MSPALEAMPPFLNPAENANNLPTVDEEEYEDFSSLKRSLSRISNSGQTGFTEEPSSRLPKPWKPNAPLQIEIPQLPKAAEIAFTALQYLPTPLLVLSSLKTVVLANEAMGRLLSLHLEDAVDEDKRTVAEILKGQTLSQIGVDMLQDGQPVWVSWEKFLDNLVADLEQEHPNGSVKSSNGTHGLATIPSGDTTPTAEGVENAAAQAKQLPGPTKTLVHDTTVDVVVSAQPHFHHHSKNHAGRHSKPQSPSHQVPAKMIISIWKLDDQHYYTLSFTSATPAYTQPSKPQAHLVARPPSHSNSNSSGSSPTSATSHPLSVNSSRSSAGSSPSEPPSSISPFPPQGAPAKCRKPEEQTTEFQKVTMMKDAILDIMRIPVLAMWRDSSLTFPNTAARKLMAVTADATSDDGYDFLSRFKAYTPDFERQLEPDENPLVQLVRTQKSFNTKLGMIGPTTGKRLTYDVIGEAIFDEKSGEFLAGLIAMKDVTAYTEQLAAQSEENEQQFQLICDSMPQMLWTTKPDGYHDYFSQRWYDYTGLTPKESFGLGWKHPFHPDDMTEAVARWKHSLATGDEYATEYRCKSKEGEWRWMLGRALPLRDHKTGKITKWFGSCTDIHESIVARQEGRRLREQLLGVLKHAEITLWTLDCNKVLTFAEGHSMWDPTGTKDLDENNKSPFVGQYIYDVFENFADARYRNGYNEAVERILDGQSKMELLEHSIDKQGRWYRSRLLPILGKKVNGGTIDEKFVDGLIGISMDVTEVKVREKENVRLLANEAAAKEASRLKSSFLANMSHEIRTPIAGIIGMSELLMDTEPLDEEQKEFSQNIQRSANGLLTVINDILDFSKVESGRLDIEEVQFSLSVVIQDVSKILSFTAERKNLRFKSHVRLGQSEDLVLLGDPGRVRQILTNLLTNSIKFTSEGFVKLSAAILRETDEVAWIEFMVEDTGIGIEEEVKKKLFKPFSQADSSTARRFGGTGLGLTICKNLVDLMHGNISLDSSLGNGTTAKFSIPFNKPQFRGTGSPLLDSSAIPDRLQGELSLSCNSSTHHGMMVTTPPVISPSEINVAERPPQAAASFPGPSTPGGAASISSMSTVANLSEQERHKRHVLVVEDNAINQQIALKTIRNLKFSVNGVWNGQEALDYLMKEPSEDHPWPDIILMDVQMPILDGYRATHLLRHHAPYKDISRIQDIPIVAMTASAIQGDREKCERAGMDDYLAKPVKRATLERMLLKWFSESKRAVEPRPGIARFSSEHDSECLDGSVTSERFSPIKAVSKPPRMPELPEQPLSPSQANGPVVAGTVQGLEDEGERGLRRVEAEETASRLRDDKLVMASSESKTGPENAKVKRPPMPRLQLSEYNIQKLNRSNEESTPQVDSTPEPSTPPPHQPDTAASPSSNQATELSSTDSPSAVSQIGSLRALAPIPPKRISSDRSDSTARPSVHG